MDPASLNDQSSQASLLIEEELQAGERKYAMGSMMTGSHRGGSRVDRQRLAITGWITVLLVVLCLLPVREGRAQALFQEQLIPILGVMMEETPTGQVAYIVLSFEERADHGGLAVQFKSMPGRFSPMAQTAVVEAIDHAARALGLSPDSWNVMLSLPYPGLTISGDSYSAMVALSVVALAKGECIPPDRVITGTVTPNGHIGGVSGVPLKVAAANEADLRMVLVPEEQDEADSYWETPFLMQVSPVATVIQAYQALTDPSSIP